MFYFHEHEHIDDLIYFKLLDFSQRNEFKTLLFCEINRDVKLKTHLHWSLKAPIVICFLYLREVSKWKLIFIIRPIENPVRVTI